ncbi:MAG: methionine--tRNA ligase subunit beta [Myxococcota bacterium]
MVEAGEGELPAKPRRAEAARRSREPKDGKAAGAEAAAGAPASGSISFDEFLKVELVAATVLSAEAVPGADKLLRLEVDLGSERRQVVSGIAKHYAPADLVGRQVVVVKNLAPRKIFKLESHGMILASDTPEGGLALIQPSAPVAPGTRVG